MKGNPAMRIHHMQVSVGTSDKQELASFYERLLQGTISRKHPDKADQKDDPGWTHLDIETDTSPFRINFEFDKEWQPPVFPSEPGKNNITQHLDIFVYDLDDAVKHAENCGAKLDAAQFDEGIRIMRDPHGHPFCLILAAEA